MTAFERGEHRNHNTNPQPENTPARVRAEPKKPFTPEPARHSNTGPAANPRPALAFPASNHDQDAHPTEPARPGPAFNARPGADAASEPVARSAPVANEVDRAFDRSLGDDGTSAPYETSYQLKQGLFGERQAAEALSARGHAVLSCKPDIRSTNQSGIDIITLDEEGTVYLIDNKAYTTGKNVSAVPALTDNYRQNLEKAESELRSHAAEQERPLAERAIYEYAADEVAKAICGEPSNCQPAVTTSSLAADGHHSTGVTPAMQQQAITYLNLLDPATAQASAPAPAFSTPAGGTASPTPPAANGGASLGPKMR